MGFTYKTVLISAVTVRHNHDSLLIKVTMCCCQNFKNKNMTTRRVSLSRFLNARGFKKIYKHGHYRTHYKTFLHKTSHKFQDGVLTFQKKGDDAERRWKQVTLSHAGAEPRGLGSAEENRGDKSNITTMPQSYFSSHHSFSFRTCNNHQVYQSTTAATTKQQ